MLPAPRHSSDQRESARRWGEGLLALGYNGSGAERLQFAEEEASGVATRMDGMVIAGDGAKKKRLLADAGNFRWLHFSCHGYFDPADPLNWAWC